ncbi:uncharacterized protein LOC143299595 [Babylonia areolata]|uniref:uncharacterized protein LOC143299595 n=1 Tax=Babylonia areolata TaxID=304850 RepID=UPI003FD6291D
MELTPHETKMSVLVLEEGGSFAKVAAHLEKGQSFGDYHRIFMSGGVKSVNDPDHERFIQSLPFLQGWPLQKLEEENSKSVFLYFKRGDVIVRDSKYSDWIVVVKSGSLAVMKKLRKVEAYEWKRPQVFTFVSDKVKRERQEQLTKMRKQTLDNGGGEGEGGGGGGGGEERREEGSSMTRLHVPGQPQEVTAPAQTETSAAPQVAESGEGGPLVTVETIPEEEEEEDTALSGRPGPGPEEVAKDKNPDHVKLEVRTIQQELDDSGLKKDPDDISAADLNPEFVHVQTLTKGMCFGLSDVVLGQDGSFCVVSNGADVLLVNKHLYQDHASEGLLRRMRQALCPYPSEDDLQSRLQTSVDWDAYRQTTLADTLKSVRRRKYTPLRV